MSGIGHPHVELGMYPFASVAWAWDDLWGAVHALAPWTPPRLTRSGDVHARWYDVDCVVTQVCGGPFAALHRHDMHLIGTFTLDLPEAHGTEYRSVLLSPHETTLDALVREGCHAVANSADSLSGWLSLLAATVGAGAEWPGRVTFTSAHVDSIRALAAGQADVASIDSWSLALVDAEAPDLVSGLHRVGHGPWVPTPAITARRSLSDDQLEDLGAAFASAAAHPATAAARAALRITGFARVDMDAYLATLVLAPG